MGNRLGMCGGWDAPVYTVMLWEYRMDDLTVGEKSNPMVSLSTDGLKIQQS